MFVTLSMIENHLDNVVLGLLKNGAYFDEIHAAMAQLVTHTANITMPDDVSDTEAWLIKPIAAIMAKMCLPKVDVQNEIYINRINDEYNAAMAVLKQRRAVEVVTSTTTPDYGTMEGYAIW